MFKKEVKVLIFSLLLTTGILGLVLWLFMPQIYNINSQSSSNNKNSVNVKARIGFGEKILNPGNSSENKQNGTKAIAQKNYKQAITKLTAYLKQKPNDPEALIYLNNAKIATNKNHKIIVSVPFGTDPNTALEILRGIAQAQTEINNNSKINGISLKVGISDDENNPEIAEQIAAKLVDESEILGVVCCTSSDSTLTAGQIYNSGKLVVISPTSTSVKLTNFSPYVFRTVPSDFIAARSLANHMTKNLKKNTVAVFYNSQSAYSQSLKSEFASSVLLEGGKVTREVDLSQANFSAAQSVKQAIAENVEVLMLAVNSGTLDKALQIVQVNEKRLHLLGGDDVYTLKTLEIGRKQALGMVIAVPWHIDANTKSEFTKASRKLWNADVNWRTAMAYDATKALIAALKISPTRTGIQQAFLSADFSVTGAGGEIRFLPSGDRNAPVQLVKVVTGNRSRTGYDFKPIEE